MHKVTVELTEEQLHELLVSAVAMYELRTEERAAQGDIAFWKQLAFVLHNAQLGDLPDPGSSRH